jgi:hypothetical protein
MALKFRLKRISLVEKSSWKSYGFSIVDSTEYFHMPLEALRLDKKMNG